jgi:GNAT superfamily N-acetyltransferase
VHRSSLFPQGGAIILPEPAQGGPPEKQDGRMPRDRPGGGGRYRLDSPRCDQDWQAYHGIRRLVFHLPQPDEPFRSGTHPLVLFLGNKPIGAIQVDELQDQTAALRLVAIDPTFQCRGHGRVMLEQAEQFVRELGCRRAVVYATPDAAGFYQAAGYNEEDWDDICIGGIVQMLKKLD